LIEAPTILHAVVFAGFCPTTCTCDALAYACKRLYFDCPYTLLVSMIDNLARKLMVDILHPVGFFAFAFLDSTYLLLPLQLLTLAIEPSSHKALISAIAKEPCSLASDMRYSRHFDAKINSHDSLPIGWFCFWQSQGNISYPLPPLFLDTEYPWFAHKWRGCTREMNLLCFPIEMHGKDKHSVLNAPVLIVPLTDGLFEDGDTAKLKRTL
jgi:hypothetical protein